MNTIAIGIFDRILRFLEVNNQREITFIQSVDIPFSFTECFKLGYYDDTFISEASLVIKDSLKNINYSSSKIFILLDTNYSFLNIIPLDFEDSDCDVSSFILWDISNYYPENYKNFKINYYKLNNYRFTSGIKATLIAAIENTKLEIIRKIFHSCRMPIHMFDLDHFAADKYATEIFVDNSYPKEIISLGCKRNRIDISITGQKGLRYYDFINFKDVNYQNKLSKLIFNLKTDILLNQIELALVYGEDYVGDVCKYLSNKFNFIKFKAPNPLENFKISDKKNIDRKLKTEGNKFIPLFGLILKGI